MGNGSVAVLPWWPHAASEEEVRGLRSIRDRCRLPLVCVLPAGCAPPDGLDFARMETFDAAFFKDQWSYSRMLLSLQFYKRFGDFETIVIVQSDVLLLNDLTAEVVADFPYDLVGAPWIKYDASGRPHLDGAGNGGFSLRRTQSFIDVLQACPPRRLRSDRAFAGKRKTALGLGFGIAALLRLRSEILAQGLVRAGVHEDTFWARLAPLIRPSFKVCPAEVAARFSVEKEPAFLAQYAGAGGPIGAHAWMKHGGGYFQG